MKVDGSPYEIEQRADGWVLTLNGVAVSRPFRSKGEALSAALARSRVAA